MKNSIIVLILTLFTLSCCKEERACYGNMPVGGINPTTLFGTQYNYLSFNPSNPKEFVAHSQDAEGRKLIKYNYETNIKTILINSAVTILSPIHWAKTGWIYFCSNLGSTTSKVYRIKADGSQLEQVTTNGISLSVSISADGETIFYNYHINNNIYFLSHNLHTAVIDTLFNYKEDKVDINEHKVSSSNDMLFFVNSPSSLFIRYSSDNSIKKIFDFTTSKWSKSQASVVGICWDKSEQYIYFSIYYDGIYRLNIKTSEYSRILQSCDDGIYGNLSLSSDGNFLITDKLVRNFTKNEFGTPVIYQTYKPCVININTLEETIIDVQ